jgi:hypothetical protein
MKHELNNQFTPNQRALLLLTKYQLEYVKDIVNGLIQKTRKNNETEDCNYWNEVAVEIKKRIYGK